MCGVCVGGGGVTCGGCFRGCFFLGGGDDRSMRAPPPPTATGCCCCLAVNMQEGGSGEGDCGNTERRGGVWWP